MSFHSNYDDSNKKTTSNETEFKYGAESEKHGELNNWVNKYSKWLNELEGKRAENYTMIK